MSATTIVMILSLAAAPSPPSTRAPKKDLYEVAVADQILEAMQMRPQMRVVGRRPKISAAGTMIKFAYPRAMMHAPVCQEEANVSCGSKISSTGKAYE